jgi:polysaccharide biosynthesis transport protein
MSSPTNYVSVTRRPPDIEDYIDMMRRYRSWIIGPMFAGLVLSVVVAWMWDDTYESTALIKIAPQQISERLVPSEVTRQMAEQLNMMEQDILSRGKLIELIKKPSLDLYKKEQKIKPLEDIVTEMKTNALKISMLAAPGADASTERKLASAFQISFKYYDRFRAQQVVAALVGEFMEENSRLQKGQAKQTSDFLDEQVKHARARLDELNKAITDFKIRNQGKLPEQAAANVAMANSLQQQVANENEAINRDQSTKMLLDSQLQGLQSEITFWSQHTEDSVLTGGSSAVAVKNQRLIEVDREISQAEATLSEARKTFRDTLPRMQQLIAKIDNLKSQRDEIQKADAAQAAQDASTATASQPTIVRVANPANQAKVEELKNRVNDVRAQIATAQMDIEKRQNRIAEINRRIGEYQARIEAGPLGEQQYMQLIGDLRIAQQDYDEKAKKQELSATAVDLEDHMAGEHLEVLDNASLPEDSVWPNRPAWVAIGTGLGLMVGIMLAGAREMKNTSLKNLKDVRAYTNLPVLSSIPLLENALLIRRKRRLFWLAWSAAIILGSVLMAGSIYYRYMSRG